MLDSGGGKTKPSGNKQGNFWIKDWAKGELPFALGFLGFTPSEFYSFTISEWHELLEGWKIKRNNEIHEKAIVTLNIMASSGNLKKGTDFGELYKHLVKTLKGEADEKGEKKPMTEEELEAFKQLFGLEE
jgi:hypothetical protein